MTIHNGTWLDSQVFPDTAWAVPGIIPEGCCILAGAPKIGKSFLVLGIALAASRGGAVLGLAVEHRPVLYLALEDSAQRLQSRARMLLDDQPLPEDFYFMTQDGQQGAEADAKQWVESNCDRKPMVIVDTLERIRAGRSSNAYADDYQAGKSLQSYLVDGGSVIAVHHTRKAASDDFLDAVSGTLGLAGSVDTVITLTRSRKDSTGILSVTGRDVEENAYPLAFTDGVWTVDGTDLADAANKMTERKLGAKMIAVLHLVNSRDRTTASDVVDAALDITGDAARQYLRRLADEHKLITRISAGSYGPVTVSQVSQDPDHAGSGNE